MQLAELLRALPAGEYETNMQNGQAEIGHLTLDSRACREGSLYFAVRGLKQDGHAYLGDALGKGAVALVVEEFAPFPKLQIKVKNVRSAMSRMAAAFYGYPARNIRLMGVTGTNGKTSVTFLCRGICMQWGRETALIGTSGIFLGHEKIDFPIATSTTPDPIELQAVFALLKEKGAKVIIMEATAQAMYFHKLDGLTFDVCVFTNLTEDHLDLFGTMEIYANAKKQLFLPPLCGQAVVNCDDETGREILAGLRVRRMSYGLSEADLTAKDIVYGPRSTDFTYCYGKKEGRCHLPLAGRFNVYNALAAMGAMLFLGAPMRVILEGLESFAGVPGRFESPDIQADFSVIIDYAHTPDGLLNILESISSYKQGRLITVFGCGGNRDSAKRPVMGEIAARLSDYVFVTSDNPRFEKPEAIIADILPGMKGFSNYEACSLREEAVARALSMAQKGDVVLIAGKGDEPYQEIEGVKHPFSDRALVEQLCGKPQPLM